MNDQLFLLFESLQKKALKLTPARRIMLEILLDTEEQLLNATELFDRVKRKNMKISFSTVYRNLEVLVDCGLLEKISFEESSKYKLFDNDNHRHHLICTDCSKTEPLPYCPIGELEKAVRKDSDFLPLEHRIEIYGFCKNCRQRRGL